MVKLNNICYIIILVIIIFSLGYYIGYNFRACDDKIRTYTYYKTDTVYNKIVLDSIEYNIRKKDSIIIELNKKFKNDIYEAKNNNDSDAIKQFIELAGAD